ncbi:hypothetical protein [Spartinivicinus ruber]|uniref:hypothetical protein n=1 Tax=Spartinivicinus ruber TaxID=2683272 RepID=UPI0013D0BAC7|nr:hypothetical protein [Spartinivicinus ruber]
MPTYLAGWNVPGYLPEVEPATFSTHSEALDYIKDEIKQHIDLLIDSGQREQIAPNLKSLCCLENCPKEGKPVAVFFADYVYWIQPQ